MLVGGISLLAACPTTNEEFCTGCFEGQNVYFCNVPTNNNRICAYGFADAQATCGAGGVVGEYKCDHTSGGTFGGDTGGGTGDPFPAWNPDDFIRFDRATGEYVIDRTLVDDIAQDGRILWAKDDTRLVALSGGYFELQSISRDDLAQHLGLRSGDVIKSANGIDLKINDDYALAIVQLFNASQISVGIERPGVGSFTLLLRFQ